jgi:uncharacterized OsmC-like protein
METTQTWEALMTTTLNGWDVDAMTQAVTMVKEQPEAGLLTWRGRSIWDGGFGLDVRTREIEQLGEVMDRHFTLRSDHPPELLGHNTGTTAVETVLAALGACMTGQFAAEATRRGVRIDSLTVDLECTNDLNGMFGLQPIRPGLRDVTLSFRVASDADEETLQEILDTARSLSPIFDTVTKPVAVATTLQKES